MSQITFYHPNPRNAGSAASFSYSDKLDCVFATIVRQSGWDDAKKIGSFKASHGDPKMEANIKLGNVELGGILDCLDRARKFTNYHDDGKTPKNINFNPFYDKVETTKQAGFDFSINITDKEDSTKKDGFFIRFTLAEGRVIREFLIHALNKSFNKSNVNYKSNQVNSAQSRVNIDKTTPEKLKEAAESRSLASLEETADSLPDPLVDF